MTVNCPSFGRATTPSEPLARRAYDSAPDETEYVRSATWFQSARRPSTPTGGGSGRVSELPLPSGAETERLKVTGLAKKKLKSKGKKRATTYTVA
jgi:hypothetical protein